MKDADSVILENLYENVGLFGPIYHRSKNIQNFSDFNINKTSQHSTLGPAIYATFGDSKWNPLHLKNSNILKGYVKGRIIDLTQPTNNDLELIGNLLGRKLDHIPFITLEKRYGSVVDGLKSAGYSAAIHMIGSGSFGKHIAIFSPNDIKDVSS